MRVAEAFAKVLKLEGVEQIFCFPSTPLMDVAAKAGIRPIIARQERVAGNMADGFSRISNGKKIGVCTVQQSAGAENAYACLAQAYTDSSPVLFVPGQWSRHTATLPPNFHTPTHFASVSKWADMIPSAAGLLPRLRRAFTMMRSGRPRPVVLELPLDVAFEELEDFDYTPPRPVRAAADPRDVSDALDLLLAAEHPMIWAGQGVLYAEASAELTEFAELLGAPVATTLMGKSGFNEQHPLALGTASYSRTAMVTNALETSDAVFAIGASLTRDFTAPALPPGKKLVQATTNPNDLNIYYPTDVALAGDAKLVLGQLIEELKDRKPKDRQERRAKAEKELASQRARWRERWAPKLRSEETPINPYRVIHDFMQTFDPAQTIVSHESGGPRDQLVPIYESTTPRSYLGWGHSTQLGFSLGASLGAKVAAPDKLVAHFMGDAGIGMVGTDLETGVRAEIPILTIIFNNARMGNYERIIPKSAELYDATNLGGHYTDMARSLGCHSERVDRPGEIVGAFGRARAAMDNGQPALVEFMTAVEPDIPYLG